MENLVAHCMAVEADRKTLDTRAERRWQARCAAAAKKRPALGITPHREWVTRASRARWSAGTVLLRIGVRLQGGPRVATPPSPAEP
jgi:hypothetical protein